MKNQFYLAAIVIALLSLSILTAAGKQTGRQAWEYKDIVASRTFTAPDTTNGAVWANDWNQWAEDGKALPAPVNMLAKLKDLGDQGWELVSVTPTSSAAGTWISGATTHEIWLFKRPKS